MSNEIFANYLTNRIISALKEDGVILTGLPGKHTRDFVDEVNAALTKPSSCKGVTDSRCDYLSQCDHVCNKCGNIHDKLPYKNNT